MKTQSKLFAAFLILTMFLAVRSFADDNDPPNRVVRLSYMDGAVSFEPAGENDWSQATLNYPLTTGDRLWTDVNARAELETGNVAVRMSQQTDLTETSVADQLMQFGLAEGTLRVRVFDLQPDHTIEIDTPNAAITIVQAGDYRIETYPDQNMSVVTVNTGEVQVTGNNINQLVDGNTAVQLNGTNPVQLQWIAVAGPDSFDQWSSQRDQKYQNAQAKQYVSPEVPGYYDLDGYGSWANDTQYGPVWYPASVQVGWAPYRFGRWVWVEPWGWTWVDDAPWGFAPFHYGRWALFGPRWGWIPGPIGVAPIYGPAFVAFVGGPGFSVSFGAGRVAAWFPLGPGEPFYPWYHYSPGYLRQINVTNVRNFNVTNITNVNNFHYRYQTVGTTAVSENTFRNAEPVMGNQVKVNPQQLERAQVIPHPQINPTPKAIAAGGNVVRPPVSAQRPVIVQHQVHTTAAAAPPRGAEPPRQSPQEARNAPPAAARPVPQPPRGNPTVTTNRSTPENRPVAPPATSSLVARTPPPQPKLSYQQKAPAMAVHPGRPLEPQQRSNIYAGKPAGPMRDQEFPPHAGPVRAQPAPASHGSSSKH